jgi:glycosyltransferase involved in cell wall biosynthesis
VTRALPDISVIVPYYRGEALVADAVASVLAQGAGLEVVIVDDASPDPPPVSLGSLNGDRVRVLRHPHNRGIGAARNTGVEAARAGVVAFLDQDDLWLPGRADAQLDALRAHAHAGVGLVFGHSMVRDEQGREWMVRANIPLDAHRLTTSVLLARMIAGRFPPLGTVIVRREIVLRAGGFSETLRGGSDDFDLMVRLAEQCRFAGVDRAVYVRRLHAMNYTSARRMSEEAIAIIDGVESRHPELRGAARAGRAVHFFRRAAERHLSGDRAGAAADYRRAMRNSPWKPRVWLGALLWALGPAGDALARRWVRARGGRVPDE